MKACPINQNVQGTDADSHMYASGVFVFASYYPQHFSASNAQRPLSGIYRPKQTALRSIASRSTQNSKLMTGRPSRPCRNLIQCSNAGMSSSLRQSSSISSRQDPPMQPKLRIISSISIRSLQLNTKSHYPSSGTKDVPRLEKS